MWRCQLAAAYRGGSRPRGCYGYLPSLASSPQVPLQPLRHQFPSSSIGDEFNHLLTFLSVCFKTITLSCTADFPSRCRCFRRHHYHHHRHSLHVGIILEFLSKNITKSLFIHMRIIDYPESRLLTFENIERLVQIRLKYST